MDAKDRYKQAQVRFVCNECGAEAVPGSDICNACGQELVRVPADPMVGTLLPRRYRILTLIGRGAMSVVYKGAYEPLDQVVAIKVLKSHMVSDPQSNRRFSQEARTSGALSHPNIIGILDFGITDQGIPYIIMEYLKGKSLAAILAKEERLPVSRALRIFSQAADALAYAHKQGVVHRDIKPSNIIVMDTEDETDVVKIVDFGIAKILHTPGDPIQKLTQTGEVIGTPLYMSPEQCAGKDLDGRSDIYSLGCVMYEALTGKAPLVGATPLDTMKAQMVANPDPIEKARPDLMFPERLKEVIALAMIKDTRQRYQYMDDVLDELQAISKRPDLAKTTKTEDEKADGKGGIKIPKAAIKGGAITLAALALVWGIYLIVRAVAHLPDEALWKKYSEQGRKEFQAGGFKQSEEFHRLALQEAERFKQPDVKRATSLNDLASDHYAQENYPEAEKLAKQALAMRDQLSSGKGTANGDKVAADSLHILSQVYAHSDRVPAAGALGEQALHLREKLLGPEHPDVASSLIDLAELNCQTGNIKVAAGQLERAIKITNKTFGEESSESASALNNLALVKEKQDDYAGAEALFAQALGIRQKALGLGSPLVAETLKDFGSLKFVQHKDAEAEGYLNNALQISKDSNGAESAPTADILSCLAILHEHTGKTESAEAEYRQSLEIMEKLYGSSSPRILKYVEHLGGYLRRRGDKTGADVYAEQAKNIKANPAK